MNEQIKKSAPTSACITSWRDNLTAIVRNASLSACLVLFPALSSAAINVFYASPIGDENWRMTGSRLRCGLSLTIPNFGIAYFEQYAAKQPHFILDKWQQVERRLVADVLAMPPMWKPYQKSFYITKTAVNPGQYAIFLQTDPAIKVLTYLAQGYQARFQYISEQGFGVNVSLSPIRFQKVYSRYQRCLGNLLPFTYHDVADSTILFDIDSAELTDDGKVMLNKIVEYCQADPSVKKIRVEGYTDDTGRKSYNNAISEDRAKVVEAFLLRKGIEKHRLNVTWFGIEDPVATNDTDTGRAENRRVEIKLLK